MSNEKKRHCLSRRLSEEFIDVTNVLRVAIAELEEGSQTTGQTVETSGRQQSVRRGSVTALHQSPVTVRIRQRRLSLDVSALTSVTRAFTTNVHRKPSCHELMDGRNGSHAERLNIPSKTCGNRSTTPSSKLASLDKSSLDATRLSLISHTPQEDAGNPKQLRVPCRRASICNSQINFSEIEKVVGTCKSDTKQSVPKALSENEIQSTHPNEPQPNLNELREAGHNKMVAREGESLSCHSANKLHSEWNTLKDKILREIQEEKRNKKSVLQTLYSANTLTLETVASNDDKTCNDPQQHDATARSKSAQRQDEQITCLDLKGNLPLPRRRHSVVGMLPIVTAGYDVNAHTGDVQLHKSTVSYGGKHTLGRQLFKQNYGAQIAKQLKSIESNLPTQALLEIQRLREEHGERKKQ